MAQRPISSVVLVEMKKDGEEIMSKENTPINISYLDNCDGASWNAIALDIWMGKLFTH